MALSQILVIVYADECESRPWARCIGNEFGLGA